MLSALAGWLGHPALYRYGFGALPHAQCVANTATIPAIIGPSPEAQITLTWQLGSGYSTQHNLQHSNVAAASGASDTLAGVVEGA